MAESETRLNDFGAAIIDDGSKFRALSKGFRSVVGCPDDTSCELDAVFAHNEGLRDWIVTAISARASVNFNGDSFRLQVLPIDVNSNSLSDDNSATFFLVASRLTPPNILNIERIRRLQHDIKNQLGGLKLYTNFLRKRLADDNELIEIIDKMNNIVGAITQQVSQIRQEEGQ